MHDVAKMQCKWYQNAMWNQYAFEIQMHTNIGMQTEFIMVLEWCQDAMHDAMQYDLRLQCRMHCRMKSGCNAR